MQQGNYQAAVMRQNAGIEHDAAADSISQGQVQARQFYRQVGQVKGDQIAEMAANGIDPSYGSGLRVQEDTEALSREDANTMYRNQLQTKKGYVISGMNDLSQARAAKAQGESAFVGSIFKAGASLMGGFQQQDALHRMLALTRRGATGM